MKQVTSLYRISFFKRILLLCIIAAITLVSMAASIRSFIENNPPKNRDYSIYLYGETHGDKKIINRELELWYDFYHNHGMRHLFIESSYFDSGILNLWMQAEDDYYLDYLYEGWEGSFSYDPAVRNFYVQIKINCPETNFQGHDVGHQHDRAREFYLNYLQENGLKDSEEYRLTLESINQGIRFYNDFDMEYREEMMTQNFIREFDSLNNEKVMGIFGGAHIKKDIFGYIFRIDPMAYRLKEYYGNIIYAKQLDRL